MTAKKVEVMCGIFWEIHDGTVYSGHVSRPRRDRAARNFAGNFVKTNRILDKNGIRAPSVPHRDAICVRDTGGENQEKTGLHMRALYGLCVPDKRPVSPGTCYFSGLFFRTVPQPPVTLKKSRIVYSFIVINNSYWDSCIWKKHKRFS